MVCEEEMVDLRAQDPETREEDKRQLQLAFRLNHTMPATDEYRQIMKELFGDNLGERSVVISPILGGGFDRVKIGCNVTINSNLLAMARGGITIEDDVQIASNVQLLTIDHDPYERMILRCRPILIKKGAWIGAGATILPGICVGEYAIVGAASVVTKDVPDHAVAVGNPARVVKMLDADRFRKQRCEGE